MVWEKWIGRVKAGESIQIGRGTVVTVAEYDRQDSEQRTILVLDGVASGEPHSLTITDQAYTRATGTTGKTGTKFDVRVLKRRRGQGTSVHLEFFIDFAPEDKAQHFKIDTFNPSVLPKEKNEIKQNPQFGQSGPRDSSFEKEDFPKGIRAYPMFPKPGRKRR